MNDIYWPTPQGTYDERRQAYLEYCAAQSPGGKFGFLSQIARLELGRDVDEQPIREAIEFVYSNQDCNDFSLAGFLRILYKYKHSPHISQELIGELEKTLLWFKYWWDEPGRLGRCYWTENHQIIFHSDELLAGQLFPDATFENDGNSGQYHIDHALHYIRRWLTFRVRFGFSEWLSNIYFEEDLLALVNLYDFAQQDDVRENAGKIIDMLMFEMALHSYRGVMGCTHGRTYTRLIKGARGEDASNTIKLMFGMGVFNNPATLGTVQLVTSGYRCPPVIEAIAADLVPARLMKERHSLNIADAHRYGLSYDSADDGHLYWSIQDYVHPAVMGLNERLRTTHGVSLHEDYQSTYDRLYQWQIAEYGEIVDAEMECHAMTEVHVQTYRTGDYMLSAAQDYRAGKPGYQQHPWQATLGIDALVFTNHPGADDEISRPNFWAGNCILPRVAQHENVLICIHHVPKNDPFPYSHAYFPRDAFVEVVERGNWVFGRKDDGYIALYSQHKVTWHEDRFNVAHPIIEARAASPDNVWIVEMGNAKQWGDFEHFVAAVAGAHVNVAHIAGYYASPSVGDISLTWQGAFKVKGEVVELHNYPRFDNPYCTADFDAHEYHIAFNGMSHTMKFDV
ncbi:MAG: hypothetical protein H6670_17200 [Anaerolineaceae bacterium]|nr:hypothetical protein [Anaerolineaceae bacterium]